MDFNQGHNLLLSTVQSSVHIGAHADSSSHYHANGEGIEKRPLSNYFGDCQVIEVIKTTSEELRIKPNDFTVVITAKRVLFKTRSFPTLIAGILIFLAYRLS